MKTFFGLLFALSTLAHADVCSHRFAQSIEECKALESWTPKNFTTVEDLDQKKSFTIIFHSITGFGWSGESNPKPGSFNEKILNDPSLISNNPKISASVITNLKPKTFRGYIGLILGVQPEHLVGTSSEDAGSPPVRSFSEDEYFMLDLYSSNKKVDIRTPKVILDGTVKYNEVILTGTDLKSKKKVIPTGVIIRCSTPRMQRLNGLRGFEFDSFVKSKCSKFSPEVILALDKLRSKYPMFAYPLE